LNSLLKKLLEATRLTGQGHLVEATAAIQRALSGTSRVAAAPANPPRHAGSGGAPEAVAQAAAPGGFAQDVADVGIEVPAHDASPTPPDAAAQDIDVPAADSPAGETRRAARFDESSFTGASGTRGFKLFEPEGRDGRKLPLIVMLHGCTQDPDDFAAGTRMNELAEEQGFFVLYPAQAPRSNANKCWNWFTPEDQRRGHGEPALIAGMTRHVMQTHGIDADRVYVAGLSAGGAMAAILAKEYPDLYAAAGVHSGLPPGAAHDVASAFSVMKSGVSKAASAWPSSTWAGAFAKPVGDVVATSLPGAPVIVFHGDADSTVALANGDAVVAAALAASPNAVQTEDTPAVPGGRSVSRTIWRASNGVADAPSLAEQWVLHGAPHAWSGGAAAGSFTDPAGPDASREMLRFFLAHPLRHTR
jgi:poly(hydroxyalkanoate) depolymerase family esterase